MAELDLSASRSGKTSDTARPVISKRCGAHLRYMLYQAALIASIQNRDFINYYTQKLVGRQQEQGIKTKMRVKLRDEDSVTKGYQPQLCKFLLAGRIVKGEINENNSWSVD